MSTRGAVAFPDGSSWRGRYVHHGDDLAPTLRAILARDGYAGAVDALILERYGWSQVTGETSPALDPGVHDARFTAVPGYGIAYTTVDDQSAPDDWVTPDTWQDFDVERVYVLTGDGVVELHPRRGGPSDLSAALNRDT